MNIKSSPLQYLFILFLLFSPFESTFSQVTITLQPDAACGKDALLHGLAGQTNTNFGTNTQMMAATWTFQGTNGTLRSLLEFDLTSIPAGAVINSATLDLYAFGPVGGQAHSGANAGWLSRVTSNWNEATVTWATAPTFTPLNQVPLAASTGPSQDYLNIPVTTLIQDMLNNPTTSFGFQLMMQTEQIYRRLNFCSSDHAIPAQRPRLTITYTSTTPAVTPVMNLGPDTTICPGQNISLFANIPNATYTWQDNSTNQTFNVTQPGTYWVTANNCTGVYSDTIVVTGGAPSVDLGIDTTLCTGQTLTLDATQTGSTYSWQDNSTNPTFQVTSAGTYWVTVTSNGCAASDSILVNYTPPLNADLGPDTVLCLGQTFLLDANTGTNTTHLWQDNSTNPTFLVTTAGMYTVAVTNQCETVNDNILVGFAQPIVDLGPDTSLCQGQTLTLDATQPSATYIWQDNSMNPTYTVAQAGMYFVEVTINGCTNSDTIVVGYIQPLTVDLGADTIICSGQNILLNAGSSIASYLWQDYSTNNTFSVNNSGTYFVELTNSCETVYDTVLVAFGLSPVVDLGPDTVLCAGQSVILSASQPNSTYVWQDNSMGPNFTASVPGNYMVTVTNICGTVSDDMNVTLAQAPDINLGQDETICYGTTLSLNAYEPTITNYMWQDGSSASTYVVEETGIYTVNVANACGISQDTIMVTVDDCNCNIYVPNAFTPGGDEFNGIFNPVIDCDIDNYKFTIFNRWGNVVFESNDVFTGWDGTFAGRKAGDGLYNYKLSYYTDDQTNHVLHGHVNLLK